MKKIIEFMINYTIYTIYEVDKIYDEEETVGLTEYQKKRVLIKKLDDDFMLRTLKHELTHVWLYEYGHNQDDENKNFNNEDVCEIVACSNDFINSVIEDYIREK